MKMTMIPAAVTTWAVPLARSLTFTRNNQWVCGEGRGAGGLGPV